MGGKSLEPQGSEGSLVERKMCGVSSCLRVEVIYDLPGEFRLATLMPFTYTHFFHMNRLG